MNPIVLLGGAVCCYTLALCFKRDAYMGASLVLLWTGIASLLGGTP